jgi:hypothetical protein
VQYQRAGIVSDKDIENLIDDLCLIFGGSVLCLVEDEADEVRGDEQGRFCLLGVGC